MGPTAGSVPDRQERSGLLSPSSVSQGVQPDFGTGRYCKRDLFYPFGRSGYGGKDKL